MAGGFRTYDGLVGVAFVTAGIRMRHAKVCPSGSRCRPTYQVNVWSAREGEDRVTSAVS